MPTLNDTVTAFLAAREYDRATLSRLAYWLEQFGDRELVDISPDDVDDAVVRLAQRGRLKPTRNAKTVPAGKPLAPATINRHISQLRHGCGHALATAGVNQAQIMAVMGHKTLTASARYMHANTSDKAAIVAKVFG